MGEIQKTLLAYEDGESGRIVLRWMGSPHNFESNDEIRHIGTIEPLSYIRDLLNEYPALVRKMKGL